MHCLQVSFHVGTLKQAVTEASTDQLSAKKFIHCSYCFILSIKALLSLERLKLTSNLWQTCFCFSSQFGLDLNMRAHPKRGTMTNIHCHVIDNIIQTLLLAWSASESYPCLPPFFLHLVNFWLHHSLAAILPFIFIFMLKDCARDGRAEDVRLMHVCVCVSLFRLSLAVSCSMLVTTKPFNGLRILRVFESRVDVRCGVSVFTLAALLLVLVLCTIYGAMAQ